MLNAFRQWLLRVLSSPVALTASVHQALEVVPLKSTSSIVPYDENLLERSSIQWQFGDWENLAKLERDTLQHHPDRAKLALLAAAAQLQQGNGQAGRQFTRLAQEWGCSKKLISQILIAGVHNSLGRAAAVSRQEQRAMQHLNNAISIGTPGSDAKLLSQARFGEQFDQLGLPRPQTHERGCIGKPEAIVVAESDVPAWIQQALLYAPASPPLLIAGAEAAQRSGDLDTAIRYWQRLAAVDGLRMEQGYYERLEQAYKLLKSFPPGSLEEESLSGDLDKYQLLMRIHQILKPKNYFEIGVQRGRSLFLATCPAIGVDPMPMVSKPLPEQVRVVQATSDWFFAEQAPNFLKEPIDMAFIDGMHLFEFALRDFINIEKFAAPHTLVVFDDILPGHPAQAERDRRTRAWTGDVWKMLPILRRYRPDLSLLLLDAYPTGLLCVSGLNPGNTALTATYSHIVEEWSHDAPIPAPILARSEALPCSDPKLEALLMRLLDARSVV
jgi:tetratricopeptide (TPR) repeat protein